MYKILFCFILFLNLYYQCGKNVYLSTSLAKDCFNFGNGTQQCFTNIFGSISFTDKTETCVNLIVNNNLIGRIEMKVLNIFFVPNCITEYWTYKYNVVSNIEQKIKQILVPINTLCNNLLNLNDYFSDVCNCSRKCKISALERFFKIPPEPDLLDRTCGNIFTSKFYQENKDDLTKYLGDSGCELKDIGIGTIQMFFYTYSLKPDFDKVYEVVKCSSTGTTTIKIQMDFYDISGITKPNEERQKIFPNNTQIITINPKTLDNQIFNGFTFLNGVLSITGGSFPQTKYLINDKNLVDCYFLEKGANEQGVLTNFGVGEIQTNDVNFIYNKLSTTKVKYSNQSTIITNGFISATSLIADKSKLVDNGIINFAQSFLNNINGQNIQKLPTNKGFLGDYTVSCLKRKIFSLYEGDFTYLLNFKMNDNYRFVLQSNEIIPKISNCRDLKGFKNSTLGSTITFDIESLTLKGNIAMYLGDSDLNDIQIYGLSNFLIEKNKINTYNLTFNINTNKQKVDIILTAVGSMGHNSSCSLSYYPNISNPKDTEWEQKGPEPSQNINCNFILFTCFDTNNPFGFFKWFVDFFNNTSIESVITKIIIFSIIGLIILGILLCVFLPILQNIGRTNLINTPLLGQQTSNQPNIIINIPQKEI